MGASTEVMIIYDISWHCRGCLLAGHMHPTTAKAAWLACLAMGAFRRVPDFPPLSHGLKLYLPSPSWHSASVGCHACKLADPAGTHIWMDALIVGIGDMLACVLSLPCSTEGALSWNHHQHVHAFGRERNTLNIANLPSLIAYTLRLASRNEKCPPFPQSIRVYTSSYHGFLLPDPGFPPSHQGMGSRHGKCQEQILSLSLQERGWMAGHARCSDIVHAKLLNLFVPQILSVQAQAIKRLHLLLSSDSPHAGWLVHPSTCWDQNS